MKRDLPKKQLTKFCQIYSFVGLYFKFKDFSQSRKTIKIQGALIQGRWYVHILNLLTSTCIGTCTYYVQPLEACAHTQVHAFRGTCTYLGLFSESLFLGILQKNTVHQRYVQLPKQTYLIHKCHGTIAYIHQNQSLFRGCQ